MEGLSKNREKGMSTNEALYNLINKLNSGPRNDTNEGIFAASITLSLAMLNISKKGFELTPRSSAIIIKVVDMNDVQNNTDILDACKKMIEERGNKASALFIGMKCVIYEITNLNII